MSDELHAGTHRRPDGRYVVGTVAGSHQQTHTVETATAWAMAFITAGVQARHDAGIARMGQELFNMPLEVAGQLVAEVRDGRALPQPSDYLTLTPGVSMFDGSPFVHAQLDGKLWTQLTPSQTADHALAVFQSIAAAELDNRLARVLEASDIPREQAVRAVVLLGRFVEPDTVAGAELDAPGIDPGPSDG